MRRIRTLGIVASAILSAASFALYASRPDLRVEGFVVDAETELLVLGARVHEDNYAPIPAAGAV